MSNLKPSDLQNIELRTAIKLAYAEGMEAAHAEGVLEGMRIAAKILDDEKDGMASGYADLIRAAMERGIR